jgi:rRNA maturation endonuclease Nob1
MGAICDDCKQDMLEADGCTWPKIKIGKRVYQRGVSDWCEPEGRCHDCGAKFGKTHHFGCDEERCPACGGQMITCDCKGKRNLLK